MKDEPFDEAFLRRIRRLRFARRRGGGRRGGAEHWETAGRGTRAGGFLEFLDHRRYVPGDDPRAIDWKVSARTGRMHVKRFRREEEDSVALLVDGSASMGSGAPGKLDATLRLGAALSFIALAGGARLRIALAREGTCRWSRPLPGPGAFREALRLLGDVDARGACGLAAAVRAARATLRLPCVVAILSDLLERPDPRPELAALRAAGHEPILFHLLSPREIDPPCDGALLLRDSESGARRRVAFGGVERGRYRRDLEGFLQGWRRFAFRHRLGYFFVPTNMDLVDFVSRELRERGVLR